MRSLLCAVFLIAACAPGEKAGTSAASAAAGPAQKYTGMWIGRSYSSQSDTGTPYQVIASIAPDGTLRGTLTFTGGVVAGPVPIRARKVAETSIIEELGPYHSPAVNQDVVTTVTGTLKGDSLNGTFEMRPVGGTNVIRTGTFRSQRQP